MTDTRLVSIDQIAAGPEIAKRIASYRSFAPSLKLLGLTPRIRVRQIGDATGGDVFEPLNSIEAGLAENLRRAKWPHPVQVEVVT